MNSLFNMWVHTTRKNKENYIPHQILDVPIKPILECGRYVPHNLIVSPSLPDC